MIAETVVTHKLRKAWAGSGESATDAVWFSVKEKTGGTEFLGYDSTQADWSFEGIRDLLRSAYRKNALPAMTPKAMNKDELVNDKCAILLP